jgi:hypothetical protein
MARIKRLVFCTAITLLIQGRGVIAYAEDEGRWSFSPSMNDYGATGLLQMPTGRMHPDGTFALGFSKGDPYTRYSLTSQFLPWLQASFRYTDIAYADYGLAISSQSYKDKAVDLKLRLLEESATTPELSVGFRDIGGTRVFSSEYLAASRRYYSFDFTGGIAWGNMGSRGHAPNPLGFFSDQAKVREADNAAGTPGTFSTSFFRGENIGFFGGVEWATPISGLNLKAEYDANSYQQEFQGHSLDVTSPINIGVSYRPFDWLDLGLGYERGTTVMFRGTLVSDFETDMGVPHFDEKPPLPVDKAAGAPGQQARTTAAGGSSQVHDALTSDMVDTSVDHLFDNMQKHGIQVASLDLTGSVATITLDAASSQQPEDLAAVALAVAQMPTISGVEEIQFRTSGGQPLQRLDAQRLIQQQSVSGDVGHLKQTLNDKEIAKNLFQALEYYGFTGLRLSLSGHRATVVYSQSSYRKLPIAFGRVARALSLVTPETITEFDLIEESMGIPIARVIFQRDDVIRAALQLKSVDELWINAKTPTPEIDNNLNWIRNDSVFPILSWDLSPHFRQNIGGPNNFYLYQIYGKLGADVRLSRNISLSGSVGVNLDNNFDNFTYDAPSNLPRVRTNIRSYLIDKDYWVDNLTASYLTSLGPNWYGKASIGLFELMYGGIDGEILYRPMNKRWAIGLDINHVWQRDFDGQFGFQDYDVTTGHLTWYQTLPFKGIEGSLSIGRYLAKDVGATLTLSRNFENGVQVGAWATKTDISAEEFGEGAFDKGFFVVIPFDLFTTSPTKSRGGIAFRPLTRDGGAKVGLPIELNSVVSNGGINQNGWQDTMK